MRAAWLLAVLACVGCQTPRNWAYSPEPARSRTPVLAKTVAVPPAIDRRPDDNSDKTLLYLIPLMPYGWQSFTRPETPGMHVASDQWQFRPDEDIAKAVAVELQASGLFKEAFFTARASEGDLELIVTIQAMPYDATVISYCLSIYGPLLWLIGLPAGTLESGLELNFELKDRASGRSLWTHRSSRTHDEGAWWIYSVPSDFSYDVMLKDMLVKEVLPALEGLKPAR